MSCPMSSIPNQHENIHYSPQTCNVAVLTFFLPFHFLFNRNQIKNMNLSCTPIKVVNVGF